jgi:hypothetical protein
VAAVTGRKSKNVVGMSPMPPTDPSLPNVPKDRGSSLACASLVALASTGS